MMKAMDSASGLGANRGDTRRYREDLQQRHEVASIVFMYRYFRVAALATTSPVPTKSVVTNASARA